jgi:RNA polymerase sigma-70 factor (ECF subfamily)
MNPRSDAPFPVTRWSLVAGAGGGSDPSRKRAALEELCSLYWQPIHGFLRRRGVPFEEARDATQGFFMALLEEDLFAKANADHGRMRSFLLGALQRWQRGEWRKAHAEKRGGGAAMLSLEQLSDEDGFEVPGDDSETPEHYFERTCAMATLEAAMQRLAREQAAAGKDKTFAILRPLLAPAADGCGSMSGDEAARLLGVTPEALRVNLHRLRARFAKLLRDVVADTLANPTDEAVRDELDALRMALTS